MPRIPRMTSKARITRIAGLAARTFAVSLAVAQAASSVIHGAGSWIVKPPAGTLVDASQPLSANLVAAWHFDRNAAPLNLANNALSGAYIGTPTLSPTQDGIGVSASSDADYMRVPDPNNVLNLMSGPISIAVDFYYGTAAPGKIIIGRDHWPLDGYDVQIVNDGIGRRLQVEVNHNGTFDSIASVPVLTVGAMNRVLVTFSGTLVTFYVNGAAVPLDFGGNGLYTPPTQAPEDLFVGRDASFTGINFNNPITRLAFWNRALTPSEALDVTFNNPYAYMAAPTVTQPVVSDVTLGPLTSSSAVIFWTTNIPTDSLVQYGTTTAYGSTTSLDSAPTTSHSMLVSGLTVGQLYHYQVVSTAAEGTIAASPDSTFTPLNGMEFADDFIGASLDSASWVALNRPGKSGEAQYYLPSNAGVGGGLLGLTSLVDASVVGYSYTSALVQSRTFNFLYGSVEIRAKFPGGSGPWPRLRLVGANCQETNKITGDNTGTCDSPQPGSDEVVVAEVTVNNPFFVNQQIHSGTFNNGCNTLADVSRGWHTYGLTWTAASLEWKIDGVTTCTVTTGVPSTAMFLALDVALASPIVDATLPQRMAVDYVRVFQQTDTTPPTVIGVSPTDGAIGVLTSKRVTATFDESMAPASINASSILLSQNGVGVPAAVSYDAPSQTATLTPLAPLADLTTYTATVKAGPAGVADLAGNTMPGGDITWTFTTAPDNTPPVITVVKAAPGSNTALITWTTDEPSTSRVDYGTSPQSLTLNFVDPALVTAHSVLVAGLTPKTTYYFRVTSADALSNSATVPATGSSPASFVTNSAGLVVAFGFNEGTGAAVTDSSNTGNNGVINGATWTNGGRFGKALSFDGTSATITVAEAPSLDLTTGMTIEAWVKPVSLTGWQAVIYKERPDDGGTSLAWALYSTDYTAPPAVYGMLAGAVGGNQWTHATGASMLKLNAWSHLAGTFDGTALRLYVNGSLAKTLSLSGSLVVTPGPLRIGGHSTIGQFFSGLIDEVRVYNRALSKSEIQADMNSPLP